ncbi:MAG TPA: GNAT family N-acetyltransferase [Pyrinomonadaceae bacterium]|nr:GNAT family N-acetyltransferase [Pyrinomonadaceae bacterium]
MARLELGDGFRLETLEPEHAASLYEVLRRWRAEVSAGLPYLAELKTAELFRLFVEGLCRQAADGEMVCCAVFEGAWPLGVVTLGEIDRRQRSAVIECWIIPPGQGRGVGKRACRALITHAFDDLRLERVVIRAWVGNEASRAGIESMGFRYEGTMRASERAGGRVSDVALYAMLAAEWREATERVDGVRVRRARADDLAWMKGLTGESLKGELGRPTRLVLVVEGRGVLVARRASDEVYEVSRFAVAREAFGRGVGRRLFEAAENLLRREGAALMYVRPGTDAPARHRAFLRRRGFRPVAGEIWAKGLRLL